MSGGSTNDTQYTYFSNQAKWIELSVLFAAAATAVTLEVLVLYTVIRSARRTGRLRPSNLYLLDKTVGDILFLVTWYVSILLTDNQVFNYMVGFYSSCDSSESWSDAKNLLLLALDFVNTWGLVHSIYILMLLSVLRCNAVNSSVPIVNRMNYHSVSSVIAVLWVASFPIAACFELWVAYLNEAVPASRWVLSFIQGLVLYALPLTVIAVAYALTIRRLRQDSQNALPQSRVVASRLRLCRNLCYSVLGFAVSWLPYYVFFILMFIYYPSLEHQPIEMMWCRRVVDLIVFLNYIFNPIFLLSVSSELRTELPCSVWLQKMKKRRQHQQVSRVPTRSSTDSLVSVKSCLSSTSISTIIPADHNHNAFKNAAFSSIC